MAKHRWQSYGYVQAWYSLRGEFEHKQRTEMQRAAMDEAPIGACYKVGDEWVCQVDLSDEDRRAVNAELTKIRQTKKGLKQ